MDALTTKLCSKCLALKPRAAFHHGSRFADGLQPWCVECMQLYRAERNQDPALRAMDREARQKLRRSAKGTIRARHNHRRSKYGIEPAQFLEMAEAQGHACGLCGATVPGGRGTWHVDHDHETGAIRGLLCHRCNVQLGVFQRFQSRVPAERLAEWLERDWRAK